MLELVSGAIVTEVCWWLFVVYAIGQIRSLRRDIDKIPIEYI